MNIRINDKRSFCSAISLLMMILTFSLFSAHNQAVASDKFSIETKINLKKLNNPAILKVIASANGDAQVKILEAEDLNSKSTTVSFPFDQKNDVVTIGSRDNILHVPMISIR